MSIIDVQPQANLCQLIFVRKESTIKVYQKEYTLQAVRNEQVQL